MLNIVLSINLDKSKEDIDTTNLCTQIRMFLNSLDKKPKEVKLYKPCDDFNAVIEF